MMDGAEIATGGKIAGIIVAAGIAVMKFIGRLQTKGGCKKAHAIHDKEDILRQATRDEKLGRIHDAVERIEKALDNERIERLEYSRRGD